MDVIDKIVSGVKKVSLNSKCSYCGKETKGTAYIEPFLTEVLGFVYCSLEHIKEHLGYPMTQKAICDSARPFSGGFK